MRLKSDRVDAGLTSDRLLCCMDHRNFSGQTDRTGWCLFCTTHRTLIHINEMIENNSFSKPDARLEQWWEERVHFLGKQEMDGEARALYLEFRIDEPISSFQ